MSETGKGHILDLVITNTFDGIFDINMTSPFSTSDHCIIQFQVNCPEADIYPRNREGEVYYDF